MQQSQKCGQCWLQTAPEENQQVFSFEFEFEARESDAVSGAFAASYAPATTDVNFASNLLSISTSNSTSNPSDSEVSSSQIGAVARASSGWPDGVPMPAGYSVYNFEKFRPEANLFREYQVSYQSSLWEGYCTYRMWGRRGKTKQWRSNSFASEAEALGWVKAWCYAG